MKAFGSFWFQLFKVKYEQPLSTFAFKFNLRLYMLEEQRDALSGDAEWLRGCMVQLQAGDGGGGLTFDCLTACCVLRIGLTLVHILADEVGGFSS